MDSPEKLSPLPAIDPQPTQPVTPAMAPLRTHLGRINPLRLGAVALQMALLVYLADVFKIESLAFRSVLLLALGGFVVNHLLPLPTRLPFFALLSVASLGLVLGPINAIKLLLVGLSLIGLCHIPIRFVARCVLILIAAIALTLARAEWLPVGGYTALWPILGSMFMFRIVVYLYDLHTGSAKFGFWRSIAYFFMLPNVCFPMFPVVDYWTFGRTYYDENCWKIYQVGVKWIFRGLIHLLLYRLITQNLTIPAEQVADAGALVRYMLTTYLLYLQISGQFHVIVGLLHLFGFNLPETHHLYLLSASFTDFWRRINIYWKDFILKIFFNPVYFRVKHLGPTTAMTMATLVAFFFTWLLHSYQWFWIRNSFPLIWQDIFFWGILALLVLANALYEQRFGRIRKLQGQQWPLAARVRIGLQTAATFSVITTLWCLWTFQGSLTEWLRFMANIFVLDMRSTPVILGILAGVAISGALLAGVGRQVSGLQPRTGQRGTGKREFAFWQSVAATLLLLGAAPVAYVLRHHLPLGPARTIIADLRSAQLGQQDRADRDQGYYEELTNTRNYNLALWELYNRQPQNAERLDETEVGVNLPNEFHFFELAPSKHIRFRNATLSTNRWGMRDRERELIADPGTFRVAVLGASITMGSGVGDDQTFLHILEEKLNENRSGSPYVRVEFLNFSVAGHKAFQKLWQFERAQPFEPDLVLYVAHSMELLTVGQHLTQVLQAKVPIPFPELAQILDAAGLNNNSSRLEVRSTLWRLAPELLKWIWLRMNSVCREHHAQFQIVLMPRLDLIRQDKSSLEQIASIAEDLGIPMIDLTGAYDSEKNRASLRVAAWDDHPNAAGHRLLAAEFLKQTSRSPLWADVLGSLSDPSPTSQSGGVP